MLSIKEERFQENARKVAKMLLTQLNVSPEDIPLSYAETFNFTYDDGDICGLNQISKITLTEDYSEDAVDSLIEYLLKVNPTNNNFSELDSIAEIPLDLALDYAFKEGYEDFSEYEEEFAEEELNTNRLETFFKRVISTVYTPGVTRLEEAPSPENNYLATDENATKFQGAFFDGEDRYEFTISKKGTKWGISYSPDNDTKQKLEQEQKAK